MIKKLWICFYLFIMMSPAIALQIKNAIDNETVSAKISATDVTRIFVLGDRIKSVKGIKGAYTRENDEKNGEIYLQPAPLFQDRAFTILIATEQNRHFTLLFTPTFSPAETLMLVPKGVGQESAAKFEQASSYELTLNHLMQAMKNGTLPPGYVMRAVKSKTSYLINKQLKLILKAEYQGLHFRGEIYSVINNQSFPLHLDERQFYKRGTRAISIASLNLPAKASTTLYRIMTHE